MEITRGRGVLDTKERILDVAIDVLGKSPDAGMGEVAAAAGVVRRTVYGYFPSRADLVLALTKRAVTELATILADDTSVDEAADAVWADFIARLWPLVHRYRVLVVLRRGEFGEDIHALLAPVEKTLADLVERGQSSGAFGRHLPADVLSQVAWSAVFAIVDSDLTRGTLGVAAPTMTSLLLLGVPEPRARALVERHPAHRRE
ncbi:TetR/AcrR family transcriptional regulator [Herbiconiux sp. CPCC 205763]|uniref:TetR/AcrR family transcriptional regulator n=1 Tax=Herbiconiux aconitum TaxID=2970913 RepID=A0ABT2GNS4_9MICO|nr:TetR/AcrR family transcriptional regulator [Herbiconiux aconitum]MCS5717771.1 TetR/AcrR family transcriptional regulator [Herbiconiux aconitum]